MEQWYSFTLTLISTVRPIWLPDPGKLNSIRKRLCVPVSNLFHLPAAGRGEMFRLSVVTNPFSGVQSTGLVLSSSSSFVSNSSVPLPDKYIEYKWMWLKSPMTCIRYHLLVILEQKIRIDTIEDTTQPLVRQYGSENVHAFSTFRCKSAQNQNPSTWLRDFL